MQDFTTNMYTELCRTISGSGYSVPTIAEFMRTNPAPSLVLRHDVDRFPRTAFEMAKIENAFGLCATYYFRYTKAVFNRQIIKDIYEMGHEIGYHYETLARAGGDVPRSGQLFRDELAEFRRLVPVHTASMHGRPLSKWNNIDMWDRFSRTEFDLLGEAYLDIDYGSVRYYSDTGRTWHGSRYNLRDKVAGQDDTLEIETTEELISLIKSEQYDRICILTHPNRWAGSRFEWGLSWCSDLAANQVKMLLSKLRK